MLLPWWNLWLLLGLLASGWLTQALARRGLLRQQLIAERLGKAGTPQGGSSSVEMLVQFMESCPGDGQGQVLLPQGP